jgi:hypothetical protein
MKANLPLTTTTHMKPHWYKPKPEPLLAPTIDLRRVASKKITSAPFLEPRDTGVLKMPKSKSILIVKNI